VFEELGKRIEMLLTVMMMEGKRKAQDHEGQKPFDSGVIGSDVIAIDERRATSDLAMMQIGLIMGTLPRFFRRCEGRAPLRAQ
jgi:hypothetical protein